MSATPNTGAASTLTTIELDHPVIRGETEIRTVQIRKPKAGDDPLRARRSLLAGFGQIGEHVGGHVLTLLGSRDRKSVV